MKNKTNTKNNEIEKKIADHNHAKTAINAVENKIPSVSNLIENKK